MTKAARWLLLIYRAPTSPSYSRIKIWLLLRQVGAVSLKNAVYVLPRSEDSIGQFHWILREILERGGDGCICGAAFVEGITDDDVINVFQQARAADYANLLREIKQVSRSASVARDELSRMRQRFNQIKRIDFFAARGHEQIQSLLSRMQSRLPEAPVSKK